MQSQTGYSKYGMNAAPYGADVSGAANGAVNTLASASTGKLNVDNPMLWLFGIGAVTLGLVAFSTHVRVGKFNASVSGG